MIGELALEHERVDAGLQFKLNDTPEYLAKNPNGLVPTLEDGDVIVWESHSVVRYLADKFGSDTNWWPNNPAGRARGTVDGLYASRLHAPMTTIFWNVVRHPPEKRDPMRSLPMRRKTMGHSRYAFVVHGFHWRRFPFGRRHSGRLRHSSLERHEPRQARLRQRRCLVCAPSDRVPYQNHVMLLPAKIRGYI